MKVVRFKRSPLHRRAGFWRSRPGGGPALIGERSVISGGYINTKRFGLIGWDRYL